MNTTPNYPGICICLVACTHSATHTNTPTHTPTQTLPHTRTDSHTHSLSLAHPLIRCVAARWHHKRCPYLLRPFVGNAFHIAVPRPLLVAAFATRAHTHTHTLTLSFFALSLRLGKASLILWLVVATPQPPFFFSLHCCAPSAFVTSALPSSALHSII